MKIAVMQPYAFPYIGYFQLIKAVKKFVFYDDVNYKKQGWINRNKIRANKQETLFTIPLKNASSFTPINEITLHPFLYPKWKRKFLKTITQSYQNAPFFNEVFPLIEEILSEKITISNLAIESVITIANYLDMETEFFLSSQQFTETKKLEKVDRLVAISHKLHAQEFINMPGGKALYSKKHFKNNNLDLLFIEPVITKYSQDNEEFIPSLSIIDVLMFNNKKSINNFLENYVIYE